MAGVILETKLYPPPRKLALVPRPRLVERLNAGLSSPDGTFSRKLSLISAPAGYGKTTLVAEWLAGPELQPRARLAWLALDPADDDPARFWAYLLAALRKGGLTLAPDGPEIPDALAGHLINELAAAPEPVILTLDDYHQIANSAIHDLLDSLLARAPAQLHLVILTREDPPFALARLRGRGELIELRQADLAFTAAETAAFLNEALALGLGPEQLTALDARTEGWIAGLQLAGLALQGSVGRGDYAATQHFVRSFAGSNRFILDYLIEEVFRQQPQERQGFLLQTAILERMNGPLCAAVTGRADSQQMLEALETANLFIVPLDDQRRWYRYHHLFADLLRYRLQQAGWETAPLHERASRWYAEQGFTGEAIDHALAGQDWPRAAALIQEFSEQLLRQGQITTLRRWTQALPLSVIQANPDLYFSSAWALALSGRLDPAEEFLAPLEPLAREQPAILGQLLILKAHIARARHDSARVIALSEQALALLPGESFTERAIILINLGIAHIYQQDLNRAVALWAEAVQAASQSENLHVWILGLSFMGQVWAARGKLHQAADLYRQAIQIGEEKGATPITARARANLALLLYEWDDLPAALEYAQQALALSSLSGDPHSRRDAHRLRALIRQAQGASAEAAAALDAAHQSEHAPNVHDDARLMTALTHSQVALAAGDLATAQRWATRAAELSPQDAVCRISLLTNTGCHSPLIGLIQAKVLLAQGAKDAAILLLARCHQAAVQGGFGYSLIQTRLLQALAATDPAEAQAYLTEALAQGQEEGLQRTFLDEGKPLTALLRQAVARGESPEAYSAQLLAALRAEAQLELAVGKPAAEALAAEGPLVEPFSERELEILQLLAQRQTNDEIAQALVISPNTVKTHLRHIYEKLAVHDRRSAVARAHDLQLLR